MFKQIEEFPEYMISDQGDVISNRIPVDGRKSHRPSNMLMKCFVDKRGYKAVILKKPGSPKAYRRLVHRLVAMAFIENPNKHTDVAHNDGNPNNNNVNNLRWSSHRDNQMDMRKHGTMQDGEKSKTSKITTEDAMYIKEQCKIGERGTQRKMSEKFGLSPSQVNRIVKGSRWAILNS